MSTSFEERPARSRRDSMRAMLEAAKAAKLFVLKVLPSAGRYSRPAGPLIKSPSGGDVPFVKEHFLGNTFWR